MSTTGHLAAAVFAMMFCWALIFRAGRMLRASPGAPTLLECCLLIQFYWLRPPRNTPPSFRTDLFNARVYLMAQEALVFGLTAILILTRMKFKVL